MKSGLFLVALLLLMPLAVTSTTPSLPPYHEFVVRGTVSHADESAAPNSLVGIAGRVRVDRDTWEWLLLQQGCQRCLCWGSNLVLADDEGRFAVTVRCQWPHDSLAVAIVYPDTVLFGAAFALSSVTPKENTTWEQSVEDGFLCDDTTLYESAEGYTYLFQNKFTIVP